MFSIKSICKSVCSEGEEGLHHYPRYHWSVSGYHWSVSGHMVRQAPLLLRLPHGHALGTPPPPPPPPPPGQLGHHRTPSPPPAPTTCLPLTTWGPLSIGKRVVGHQLKGFLVYKKTLFHLIDRCLRMELLSVTVKIPS